jgi:hypothetical protein
MQRAKEVSGGIRCPPKRSVISSSSTFAGSGVMDGRIHKRVANTAQAM